MSTPSTRGACSQRRTSARHATRHISTPPSSTSRSTTIQPPLQPSAPATQVLMGRPAWRGSSSARSASFRGKKVLPAPRAADHISAQQAMATYVLIHGAGSDAWYWQRVIPLLRSRGHDVVAPDLPCDDDAALLSDYADAVVAAIGGRTGLILVAQS